jgi:trimeric autotransporter adhesin
MNKAGKGSIPPKEKSPMKHRATCLVVGSLSLILCLFAQTLPAQTTSSSPASAQAPPPLIQFSNVATDESGTPLAGVVNITFSLYAAQQGGEPLWTETQNDIPLDPTGHYSVQLGSTQPSGVPTALFTTGEAHWLGVQISGQAEQSRVLLLSVPYALKAGDAATIGGLPPSAFVLAPTAAADATGKTSSAESAGTKLAAKSSFTSSGTQGALAEFIDSSGDLGNSPIQDIGGGDVSIGPTLLLGSSYGIELLGGNISLFTGGNLTLQDGNVAVTSGNITTALGNVSASLGTVSGQTVNATTSFNFGGKSFAFGNYTNKSAFLGFAGNATTTGLNDTASGYQSLFSNTTGADNTANGNQALYRNTKGSLNTASGYEALYQNIDGSGNTANGYEALYSNKVDYNTASGEFALKLNTFGAWNTADGANALEDNTEGNFNTAVGYDALQLSSGSNNSALGYGSGPGSTTPSLDNTTAVGAFADVAGNNSTAIGAFADVTQENSLVLGSIANVNGCNPSGTPACQSVSVGIGTTTPQATLDVEAPTGFYPTVNFGSASNPATFTVNGTLSVGGLNGMSIASNGIITFAPGQPLGSGGGISSTGTAGYLSLFSSPSSVANSSVSENTNGYIGVSTSTGYVPNSTLDVNGTVNAATAFNLGGTLFAFGSPGNSNAFLGFAGNTTMTGSQNTAVGLNSLAANTTGNNDVALGYALSGNTTGSFNTGLGTNTLLNTTTGAFYSAIGAYAGQILDTTPGTGLDNTALGSGAAFSTGTLNNATAVGSNAEVTESNALVLGAINNINGGANVNVGIGTTAPAATLDVEAPSGSTPSVNFFGSSPIAGTFNVNGSVNVTNLTVTGTCTGCGGGGGGGGISSVTGTNGVYAMTSGGSVTLSANENVVAFQTDLATGINTAESFATTAANAAQAAAESYANTTFVTTGSNTFTGNQSISGNLGLSGLLNLAATVAASGTATTGVIALGGANFAHAYGASGLTSQNTFLGANTGNFTMTGAGNTAVGAGVPVPGTSVPPNEIAPLASNTTGTGNTAVGASGQPVPGGPIPPNGIAPLASNTTGSGNTAVGAGASGGLGAPLGANTTGSGNTAVGGAGQPVPGGLIPPNGIAPLASNTSGSGNTAVGAGVSSAAVADANRGAPLGANTTGSSNTAVGTGAGVTATPANANTTGSENTFVGDNSGPGVPTEIDNATALGANALVNCSNCMVLGDSTKQMMVGIGTNSPAATLDINGMANITGSLYVNGTQITGSGGGITSVTGTSGLTSSTTSGAVTIGLTAFGPCAAGSALVAVPFACSPFATLGVNTFTGTQSVTGNITATGTVSGATISGTTISGTTVSGTTVSAGSYLLNNGSGTFTVLASNAAAGTTNDVFLGFGAGTFTGSAFGPNNIGLGNSTLNALDGGADNTASGYDALHSTSTGNSNTGSGYSALYSNSSGSDNTAMGSFALYGNTSGSYNTALGYGSLYSPGNTTTGSSNIAIGYQAGNSYTGSETGNIDIGSTGTVGESSTIHIGSTQTATYIAGINGATVASGTAVMVGASGQLGTVTSSQRFKDNIADMGDESDLLMKLRPVTFYYKPELDPTHTRQYGLVAEEVAQVAPQLVVFDKDGTPQTVRYHFVNAMLLNQVQKQRQLIEEQQKANQDQQSTIARQQAEIQDLADRLSKLEARLAPAQ